MKILQVYLSKDGEVDTKETQVKLEYEYKEVTENQVLPRIRDQIRTAWLNDQSITIMVMRGLTKQ